MDSVTTDDANHIVHLLGEVADPLVDISIGERKRAFVSGLAEIVGADIWIWNGGVTSAAADSPDGMATTMLDGGWRDAEERARFIALITDPNRMQLLQGGAFRHFFSGRVVTLQRDDVVDPANREAALAVWSQMQWGDCLISIFPLSSDAYSSIGFHRRLGRPEFSIRERTIVQLVVENVDWLHRQGTNVSAKPSVLQLTARQRQVLLLLMAGDSSRQIAATMQLSEHTVNDYMKQIYRRFDVNSRSELLARFVSGGRPE